MLFAPEPNYFGFNTSNWDATPSATMGGLVTSGGTVDTESATPLVLRTGAQMTQDCCLVELVIHTTSGTGARNILMDFGYDPAGGTSYTWVVQNLVVSGAMTPALSGGTKFTFPLRIPAGSQVACRIQCSQVSITQRVMAKFWGLPSNPLAFKCAQYCDTIGTPSGSNGQSFTPGSTAWGSYADLGALSRPAWFWQLSYGVNNATITAEYAYIQLAWGDASNKHEIVTLVHVGNTGELVADWAAAGKSIACYCPVPAGANIYVRGYCNGAPDTGYNALAHAFGG